jgi:hypothetical protein
MFEFLRTRGKLSDRTARLFAVACCRRLWPLLAIEAASGVAAQSEQTGGVADLLRDIFGPLPFREVNIDPAWLAWNDGLIMQLARAGYEERTLPQGTLDRNRLAALADALEEAECTNEEILSHCRSPKDHVRGCWLIDLILDKS